MANYLKEFIFPRVKKKSTTDPKTVLREIGFYFMKQSLNQNNQDYDKALNQTYRTLHTMNITDCQDLGDNVFEITLVRPGILIGSRGATIGGIEKELGIKIKIKENVLADVVYPIDVREY